WYRSKRFAFSVTARGGSGMDHETQLVRAWFEAARDPTVDAAIRAMYEHVRCAIDARQPRCVASGRCCQFEKFDHQLFTTGLEAAWCLARTNQRLMVDDVNRAMSRGDCPFLIDARCSIHLVKPFGCRVYFCDEQAIDWVHDLSATLYARVAELHTECDVPYIYSEWRAMLFRFARAADDDPSNWPLIDPPTAEPIETPGRFTPLRVVNE